MVITRSDSPSIGREAVLEGIEDIRSTSPDVDRILVEKVQNGEVDAFDHLIRKYRERVYAVIYNMTGNREDAADLAQDSFIKAFSSIKRFKGKSSFYTWLYRIAVNTTLSHLKSKRSKRFFSFENLQEEVAQSDVIEFLVSKTGAEKGTLMNELQEKLNDALQTLSVKHRTVTILYEIEGLSHTEIAKILKVSEGTVRSRLHYAKQQLQSLLQDYLNS